MYEQLNKSIEFARAKHEAINQKYGQLPYFDSHVTHVIGIQRYFMHLLPFGYQELSLCVAANHDVPEDCGVSFNGMVKGLGDQIAELSWNLKNNAEGKNRDERNSQSYYDKIKSHIVSTSVKYADRIANCVSSSGTGHSMFRKYSKEHPDFIAHLKLNDDDALMPMQRYLCKVMEFDMQTPGAAFIHLKSGGIYEIVGRGKVRIDGAWSDSIRYRRMPLILKPNEDTKTEYTRSADDFFTAFIPVL